ncbi:MAG: peptidase U32 family protein [Treponemataceae bacterium]
MSELLAPAGNIEALDAAINEGADAVYMGLKTFNARMRSSNFAWNQFEAAVNAVHKANRKIFVTLNTLIEESELERMYRLLGYLNNIGPDGIIVQDLGVIRMVQEFFPNLKLHASTQMNISSSRAANLLSKEGFQRVVLSRELGLNEIKEIKSRSNIELEVFVHGALCISESGLCLFSSFLGGKSANRGMCTQACRRLYTAQNEEGEKQGYFFSPHDLQLIEFVPDLVSAGVDSFKIEGRMKSAEYVGSVTAAYRYVMDNWEKDKKEAIITAKRLLSTDFARQKTAYWFSSEQAENLLNPDQAGGTGIFLGKITQVKNESIRTDDGRITLKYALVQDGNYTPDVGDSIRLHKKDDSGRESHKIRSIFTEGKHQWIDIPPLFSQGDSIYLLQTKTMSKRYPRVIPKDLSKYRNQPRDGKLPLMELTPTEKKSLAFLPEGIYVQVSTVKDLFAVQSENPIRVILELTTEAKKTLLEKTEILPFSKKQVFISLDPFCPQDLEDELEDTIDFLVADGFRQWVVNCAAHIGILKKHNVTMIAGPYLYALNRWAASWIENQNIMASISPHEISFEALQSIYDKKHRSRVIITLFLYPALFRMRIKMPKNYDFTYFKDKEGTTFKSLSTPDGSFVLPDNPFSIVDKVKQLNDKGFTHYLIDLSKTDVKKNHFKQIMQAAYKAQVLSDTSRFNWKDGFYDAEKIEAYREKAEAYKKAKYNERAKAKQESRNSTALRKSKGKSTPRKTFRKK